MFDVFLLGDGVQSAHAGGARAPVRDLFALWRARKDPHPLQRRSAFLACLLLFSAVSAARTRISLTCRSLFNFSFFCFSFCSLFVHGFSHALLLVLARLVGVFQAVVHFRFVESAINAKTMLDGRDIFLNCCTLQIQFSSVT